MSLDLNQEKEGASFMSFGREFVAQQIGKHEASVVLRRGSARRWAEGDRNGRVGV